MTRSILIGLASSLLWSAAAHGDLATEWPGTEPFNLILLAQSAQPDMADNKSMAWTDLGPQTKALTAHAHSSIPGEGSATGHATMSMTFSGVSAHGLTLDAYGTATASSSGDSQFGAGAQSVLEFRQTFLVPAGSTVVYDATLSYTGPEGWVGGGGLGFSTPSGNFHSTASSRVVKAYRSVGLGGGPVNDGVRYDRVSIHAVYYCGDDYSEAGQFHLRFVETVPGDTNLDRQVNFDDLLSVAQSYGASGKVWTDGDFDGDGSVLFDDLLAMAQNYGFGGSADAASFEAHWALAQSVVPEPSATAFFVCGIPPSPGGITATSRRCGAVLTVIQMEDRHASPEGTRRLTNSSPRLHDRVERESHRVQPNRD